MNARNAKQIASVLKYSAEEILWGKYKNRFPSSSTFSSKVGKGQRTFHQMKQGFSGKHHEIVFGPGMISSKCESALVLKQWLTSREIKKHSFFPELTILNAVAWTVVHEFAHAIQVAEGKRFHGSVHNHSFYAICKELQRDGVHIEVRDFIKQKLEERKIVLEFNNTKEAPCEVPRTSIPLGTLVSWVHSGETFTGKVKRRNERTVTVHTETMKWRLPYHRFSVVDPVATVNVVALEPPATIPTPPMFKAVPTPDETLPLYVTMDMFAKNETLPLFSS